MILSSAAQMMNGSGGGPPAWLPSGAITFFDFVNGTYYAGGASCNVTDILGDGPDTATAGGGFNAGEISGSGMYVDNTNTNRPNAIGALKSDIIAALAAGCTFVFEIDFRSAPFGSFIWILNGTRSNNSSSGYVSAYVFGDADVEDQADIDLVGGNSGFDGSSGIKRIAVTFARHDGSNYESAVSTEGTAAETQTVAYAPVSDISNITLFHDGRDSSVMDDAFIRSITLYPAKLPADLPALSA